MGETLTIYTIGHSNSSAVEIIDLLQQFDIAVLVDVRSSPYSQYNTQFDRESFQQVLEQAGIDYRFAGDYLGGRPKDPTCYKDQQVPEGKADYLHLVDYPAVMAKDWFRKGLDRLIDIGLQHRTAIMCSEEDPATCHRHHLVGKALMDQDIKVVHIRKDGSLQNALGIRELANDPPAKQLRLL